jgi:hypothetical protein
VVFGLPAPTSQIAVRTYFGDFPTPLPHSPISPPPLITQNTYPHHQQITKNTYPVLFFKVQVLDVVLAMHIPLTQLAPHNAAVIVVLMREGAEGVDAHAWHAHNFCAISNSVSDCWCLICTTCTTGSNTTTPWCAVQCLLAAAANPHITEAAVRQHSLLYAQHCTCCASTVTVTATTSDTHALRVRMNTQQQVTQCSHKSDRHSPDLHHVLTHTKRRHCPWIPVPPYLAAAPAPPQGQHSQAPNCT